jgi:hypothetical protein
MRQMTPNVRYLPNEAQTRHSKDIRLLAAAASSTTEVVVYGDSPDHCGANHDSPLYPFHLILTSLSSRRPTRIFIQHHISPFTGDPPCCSTALLIFPPYSPSYLSPFSYLLPHGRASFPHIPRHQTRTSPAITAIQWIDL